MPGLYLPTETIEQAQKLQKKHGGNLVGKGLPDYQPLPRTANGEYAKHFKTTAHTYRIIPPGEGIGFERWGELYKMLLFAQVGVRSYDDVTAKLQQFMADMIGQAKQGENKATVWAIQTLSEVVNANGEIQSWQYDLSSYISTIFIVRDDEELKGWTRSFAEEKIADWDAHNFNMNDFFLLSMGLSNQFLVDYRNQLEKLAVQTRPIRTAISQETDGSKVA